MTQVDTIVEPAVVEEFMGRLLGEIAAAAALPATLLGVRLGLWRAMAGAGPVAADDVARATGLPEPFVREWLRAQAAGDYLGYEPATGRFTLPAAAAAVLADPRQSTFVRGLAAQIGTWYADLPQLQAGLTAGRGLGWRDRSRGNSEGMDDISRTVVAPALTGEWLPALPGGPQLRIAQDDAADGRLSRDPLALVVGMLLDQHMRGRSRAVASREPVHAGRGSEAEVPGDGHLDLLDLVAMEEVGGFASDEPHVDAA
jgi:hypothetical protein